MFKQWGQGDEKLMSIYPEYNNTIIRWGNFISLMRIDNATTARIPVAANNITYVLNRILSHTFNISIISSFGLFLFSNYFRKFYF